MCIRDRSGTRYSLPGTRYLSRNNTHDTGFTKNKSKTKKKSQKHRTPGAWWHNRKRPDIINLSIYGNIIHAEYSTYYRNDILIVYTRARQKTKDKTKIPTTKKTRNYPTLNSKYIPGMYTYIGEFLVTFFVHALLFVRAPFAQTLNGIDRGRPSGHSRRGLASIRAACRAWRELEVFFRREWVKTIHGFSVWGFVHSHTSTYVRTRTYVRILHVFCSERSTENR